MAKEGSAQRARSCVAVGHEDAGENPQEGGSALFCSAPV